MATNYKYRINVARLRRDLFNSQKIPSLTEGDFKATQVFNMRGEDLGHTVITVVKSSTVGCKKGGYDKKTDSVKERNWLGTGKHRMFIKCPFCFSRIPAGRLGQHIAYKHPEQS